MIIDESDFDVSGFNALFALFFPFPESSDLLEGDACFFSQGNIQQQEIL